MVGEREVRLVRGDELDARIDRLEASIGAVRQRLAHLDVGDVGRLAVGVVVLEQKAVNLIVKDQNFKFIAFGKE